MKKLILIFIFIIPFLSNAQNKKNVSANTDIIVSYISSKADTLYLLNNDLGKFIKRIWEENTSPEMAKPIIVLTSILPKKKSYKNSQITSSAQ